MNNVQQNLHYFPKMLGKSNQSQNDYLQTPLEKRNRLKNEYQLLDVINQQSLNPKQLEAKLRKNFQSNISELSKLYLFSDDGEVKRFLLRNQFLIEVLKEIPTQICNYFGNNQAISLRVSYDPDSFGSSDLWVDILTTLSAQEAIPLLDEFDEQWWLENMNRVSGELNITLKFV